MPYRVSKYAQFVDPAISLDHPDCGSEWTPVAEARTMMQLRPIIRELLSIGYDWDASILVEQIEEFTMEQVTPTPIVSMKQYRQLQMFDREQPA
jgi:hypothetical protein